MAQKIQLEIVTPQKPILKESVDEVTVPGIFGEFGVLPGHTTFLSELGSGRLTYTYGGHSKTMQISGGFAEVREDHVTVMADQVSEPTA